MNTKPDVVVRAEAYKDDVAVPVTLFVNYPQNNTQPVECGVIFDNQNDIFQFFPSKNEPLLYLSIRQTRPKHLEPDHFIWLIWIPRMRIEYTKQDTQDNSIRGVAELFFKANFENFQFGEGFLDCYIHIQDNELFDIYNRYNLPVYPFDETKPISWKTPFGQAKLTCDYEHLSNTKVREIPPKTMIYIKIEPVKDKSLHDFLIELSKYLDDLMWLISFLSKKYIHWSRMDMNSNPPVEGNYVHLQGYRDPSITQWNRINTNQSRLLIKLDTLQTEVAEQVFTNYTNSPNKDIIKQVIKMIMITFSDAVFEQNVLISYTALELLVNNFTDEEIIDDERFKRLESILKNKLEEILSSTSSKEVMLTRPEVDAIKKKLPELKRHSSRTRLTILFDDKLKMLPLQTNKYLNPKTLLKRLKDTVDRRNKFIHQGQIENYEVVMYDLSLIRLLVSIYILHLLNYPLDQINELDSDLSEIDFEFRKAQQEEEEKKRLQKL